jgi:hypothetical protein
MLVDFLANPLLARDVIKHAITLSKAQQRQIIGVNTVHSERSHTLGLEERLLRLQQLVQSGVLSQSEALSVRASVLVVREDYLGMISESAQLRDKQLITDSEFWQVKHKLLQTLIHTAALPTCEQQSQPVPMSNASEML